MKKFILLSILLLIPRLAFGALAATTVWEIRPANGSDLNGGCVNSATVVTDYSQQDAAQLSLTDLAVADGTTAVVTSAAAGFTSAMVGNCLHIESGTNWEPSFYAIVTFTSSSQVTLDRSPASAAATLGVGKVGGAAKTFESATTIDITDLLAGGHIVWVKNETGWNENVLLGSDNSNGAPVTIEGYNTSRGDNPTGSNRPTNDRAGGAGDAFTLDGTSGNHILKHLIGKSAADKGFETSDTNSICINCRATANTGIGFGSRWVHLIGVESDTNSGDGVDYATDQGDVHASAIHDNTLIGIDMGAGGESATFNLIYDNGDDGIEEANGGGKTHISNNTIDGNTGAATDGFETTTPSAGKVVTNNIFSNNGNYGVNATDGDSAYSDYNDFFGNVTAARINFPTGDNDSTADPTFTDAANDDFSIGTNLKALGIPNAGNSAWPLTDGYTDIGAAQRQEAASSSTDLLGVIQ